jgi:hypothetical protein
LAAAAAAVEEALVAAVAAEVVDAHQGVVVVKAEEEAEVPVEAEVEAGEEVVEEEVEEETAAAATTPNPYSSLAVTLPRRAPATMGTIVILPML